MEQKTLSPNMTMLLALTTGLIIVAALGWLATSHGLFSMI